MPTVLWILVVMIFNDGPHSPVFHPFQSEAACQEAAAKLKRKHVAAFCVQDGDGAQAAQ